MKLPKHDKLMHFFSGFFIYITIQLFLDHLTALILTGFIAVMKEVVWDYYLRKGTPELLDVAYTVAPALLMFLLL